jgi:hypothetical protein
VGVAPAHPLGDLSPIAADGVRAGVPFGDVETEEGGEGRVKLGSNRENCERLDGRRFFHRYYQV